MPAALVVLLLCGIVANATMIRVALVANRYSDFEILHASGRAARLGQPQYEVPAELRKTGAANLNPPHVNLFLLAPLSVFPLQTAAVVLWVIMALSVLGTIGLLRGILPTWWPAGVMAFVLPSAASYAAVRFINFAWPMTACFTLAWIWMRQGRTGRAGAMIGVLASMKVFLWLYVPYFIWRRQWGAALAAMVAGGGMFGAGLFLGGVENTRDWIETLSLHSPYELDINVSLYGVITRVFASSHDFAPVLAAPWLVDPLFGMSAALVLGGSWWRLRKAGDIDAEWAAVLLTGLLISPIGWIYYLPLAIGPMAVTLVARQPSPPVMLGLGLLLLPHLLLTAGQPSPWLTVTLGSAYAWGVVLIWWAVTGRPVASHATTS